MGRTSRTRRGGATSDRPLVLVIDDDGHVRSIFAFALTAADFDVEQAADGPAGIARALELQPDVVLLDSSMPSMSGFDVLSRLRADERTESTAVIMVSGHGETADKLAGFDAGANDYLVKPVSLKELVARVSAQVRHRSGWLRRIDSALQERLALSAELAEVQQSATLSDMVEQVGTLLAARIPVAACSLHLLGQEPSDDGGSGRRLYLGPWITEDGGEVLIHVPLRTGGTVFGVLAVRTPPESDEALSTLVDLAPQLGALLATGAHADQRQEQARERVLRLMEADGLRPVFQPITSLADGRVAGYEGLSRFPDGMAPEVAFRAAGRAGLALELEVTAIERIVAASRVLPSDAYISVNMSARTLLDGDVHGLLCGSRHPVVVELTEHEHIVDYSAVTTRIEELGEVRLAIDDTGTGYASLRHVYELRPSLVKLDRSWVAGLERDPVRQAMIEGLRGFTRVIGASVVGEGVERPEEAEALERLGVELGQGYWFAPPAPAADFATG